MKTVTVDHSQSLRLMDVVVSICLNIIVDYRRCKTCLRDLRPGQALNPACLATGTNKKTEVSFVASLDIIICNKRKTKALIRLRGCSISAQYLGSTACYSS